jgi:hypothetical protein
MFVDVIVRRVERLLDGLDGLIADELNWRPPAKEANSLYALAAHTIANAEENLLGTLCGRAIGRDHAAEFGATGEDAALLRSRWSAIRAACEQALAAVGPAELDRSYGHPRRGTLTGREILLLVARHVAEHEGQAQLTRDLVLARGPSPRG